MGGQMREFPAFSSTYINQENAHPDELLCKNPNKCLSHLNLNFQRPPRLFVSH